MPYLGMQMTTFQDPLQFAYHPRGGIEDAILYLLQQAHSHLDKTGSTVRIMLFNLLFIALTCTAIGDYCEY